MTLDASERLVAKAERLLESSIPAGERLAIVSELGVSADAWAALTQNCGPQDSTVRVQLSAKRSLSAQEYAGKLRRLFEKELPGARTRFEADGTGPPVEIRIEGGSLAAAAELAAKVRDRVAHVRGTADVDVVQRLDARVLSLDIDRAKAAALGLSTQDVVGQTRAAWGADLAEGTLRFDLPSGAAYPLIVKYHQEPAGALDALLRMPVAVPNQHVRVPLATVVAVRQQTGPVEVDHIALQRVMSVRAAISGRAPDEVAAEIRQTLKEQPLPAGMFIEIEVNRPTPER